MSYHAIKSVSADSGSYGPVIAGILQLKNEDSFPRENRQPNFAATLVKANISKDETFDPIPHEDAFIASVSLAPSHDREPRPDGYATPTRQIQKAGSVTLTDLRKVNRISSGNGLDVVHFYFSKSALDGLSENQGGSRLDALSGKLGISMTDPTLHCLASALLPAFERPHDASGIFVNHLMLAAGAHILKEYAGVNAADKVHRGGLAAWQQKRAAQMLLDNLDGKLPLPEIALACRLSIRHFTRAFAQSMGMPPHKWLMQQRAEKSKQLMRQTTLPLHEIAVSSGFADQSHFTTMFSKLQGISPGAWRRLHANARPTVTVLADSYNLQSPHQSRHAIAAS